MTKIDALSLLRNDHRAMEALFARLRSHSGQEREDTIEQLAQVITVHTQLEEEYVYPLISRNVDGGRHLAAHASEEHQQVAEMLDQLQATDADSREADDLIQELEQSLQEHVQEEEAPDGLFAMLRSSTDPDELLDLGGRLSEAKVDATVQLGEPAESDQEYIPEKDAGGVMFVARK